MANVHKSLWQSFDKPSVSDCRLDLVTACQARTGSFKNYLVLYQNNYCGNVFDYNVVLVGSFDVIFISCLIEVIKFLLFRPPTP
jgi:hypothetical protein